MGVILVADDNSTIRRMLGYMLQAEGHTVVTAIDGQDALEQLQQHACDLIIADLDMPLMDGMDLLHQIRSSSTFSTLPFIMPTASGQDHDQVAARAAGVNDFLTKPTSTHVLAKTVQRWL